MEFESPDPQNQPASDASPQEPTAPDHPHESKRNWIRELQEQRGALYWLGTFAIGAFIIVVFPDVKAIWAVVGLLILYAHFGRRGQKDITKFADSVYFLGFLWTLIALIHALMGEIAADRVFYAFGYALLATATGMTIRMLLLQTHITAGDHIRDVQVDLDEQLKRCSNDLEGVSKDVEHFRNTSLKETFDHLTRYLATVEDEIRQRVTQATDESLNRLQESAQRFSDGVSGLKSPFKQLDSELQQVMGSLRKLHGKQQATHDSFAKTGQVLAESASKMAELKDVFSHLATSIKDVNSQTLKFAAEEMPRLQTDFKEVQRTISDLKGYSDNIRGTVSETLQFVKEHVDANRREPRA